MIANLLPTRTQFLEQLACMRGVYLYQDERSCNGCQRYLLGEGRSAKSERPVIFHGAHTYGAECALEWLEDKNTCPTCGQILFREELGEDDNVTLRRILHLQTQEDFYHQNDTYLMEVTYRQMWRELDEQRAKSFLKNELTVNLADYTVYRERHKYPLEFMPREAQAVDAATMTKKLESYWNRLFLSSASRLITGPTTTRPTSLKVACHPVSTSLRMQLAATFQRLNGEKITANDFEREMERDFMKSDIYLKMKELDVQRKAPHGFYILQALLNEAVLRIFVDPEESKGRKYASKRRPYGWVDRMICSIADAEDEELVADGYA